LIVRLNDLPGQPAAIKPIGQHIDASRRHDQPETVHFFVRINDADNVGKSNRAKDGEQHPEQIYSCLYIKPLPAILTRPDTPEGHPAWGFPIPAFTVRGVYAFPKEQIAKILQDQPDDSSYDEILRELAFARMVERGLADSDAGRTISHEEMGRRIKTWRS
jgi:hypothetical protein